MRRCYYAKVIIFPNCQGVKLASTGCEGSQAACRVLSMVPVLNCGSINVNADNYEYRMAA